MDDLNLLRQTIRFQRTALQNSLAMISAVQRHGEKFLKKTLAHSPWIPGEGRDACLFWLGLWTKNLAGMTDLVDKNLATMERLTSTGGTRGTEAARPAEKPAAEPKEPPPVAAQKAAPERQPGEEPPDIEEKKEMPPPAKQEQKALAKTGGPHVPVTQHPSGNTPEPAHSKPPAEKKKGGRAEK